MNSKWIKDNFFKIDDNDISGILYTNLVLDKHILTYLFDHNISPFSLYYIYYPYYITLNLILYKDKNNKMKCS